MAVLTIESLHIADSGKPPDLKRDLNGPYTAYFENECGEQLIFTYDYKKQQGLLWHGDYSWEEPQLVFAGSVPTLVMHQLECDWLRLVWDAAVNRRGKCNELRPI